MQMIWDFGDINMAGRLASNHIMYRIYRRGASVADTYAADARLYEFDVHYLRNTHGSAGEFVKPT